MREIRRRRRPIPVARHAYVNSGAQCDGLLLLAARVCQGAKKLVQKMCFGSESLTLTKQYLTMIAFAYL